MDPFAYGDEFALQPAAAIKRAPSAKTGAEATSSGRKEVFQSATAIAASAAVDSVAAPASRETMAPLSGMVYRVQIGIYEERKSADQRAGEARAKVELPVYVEFEPPFYRVRVGDFKTREEAEQQVKVLQNLGFRGSFYVMKKLNTP